MLSVVLALQDASLREQTNIHLEQHGHAVAWVSPVEPRPPADIGPVDVVVVDAPAVEHPLVDVCAEWLVRRPQPTVIVIAGGSAATPLARMGGIALVPRPLRPQRLAVEVERHGQALSVIGLNPRATLKVMGLEPGGDVQEDAAAILANARRVDNGIIRAQLHPFFGRYVAATRVLAPLLHRNVLDDAEKRFAQSLDGALTIRRAVASRTIDSLSAARLIWALLSGGALRASVEPPLYTPSQRARTVGIARAHLKARLARIQRHGQRGMPLYEVLEVPVTCEGAVAHRAAQLLATRYAPEKLGPMDMGDLEGAVVPVWNQILQARHVLTDPARRRQYDAQLRQENAAYVNEDARRVANAEEAEAAFMRGQKWLAAGDAKKAVPELAAAARRVDGNPDYEAYVAWARLVAENAGGLRAQLAAVRERAEAEAALLGRRPRPRALFALGLLCEAAGDLRAAREGFEDALACNPKLQPARQALARLAAGR